MRNSIPAAAIPAPAPASMRLPSVLTLISFPDGLISIAEPGRAPPPMARSRCNLLYGAPPLSVVSSEQLRLQPTSFAYDPPEQVIAEEMVGDNGGDGGDESPEPTSPEPEPGSPGGEGLGDGGGGDGGDGGAVCWNCTTKNLVPCLPFAKEKVCPKPGAAHSFPFQPSPYESVIFRVHVAPRATANGALEVFPYGAPPLSVVPSEQLRLQPTSFEK